MLRIFLLLAIFSLSFNQLNAQTGRQIPVQQLDPQAAALLNERKEAEDFARKLALLKTAFAEKKSGEIVAYESGLLEAMRRETDQMSLKVQAETAQAERRKQASSGQITQAARPEDAPARDPFAEATTPAEIRLEKMQYIFAAFQRHSFDAAQPEVAERDFSKLDTFLKLMQEALEGKQ